MQKVEDLLVKEGLDQKQTFTGLNQQLDGMLPLAIFDDTEYESRDPHGWVCKEPGAPAAPGRVALPSADGTYSFRDCTVLDYNEQQHTYLVQLKTDPGASLSTSESDAPSNSTHASPACCTHKRLYMSSTSASLKADASCFTHAAPPYSFHHSLPSTLTTCIFTGSHPHAHEPCGSSVCPAPYHSMYGMLACENAFCMPESSHYLRLCGCRSI